MNQQIQTLKKETPAKYFVEKGANIKEIIASREEVAPFSKKILGNIIAEVFKRFQITETSRMLDRMKKLRIQVLYKKLVLQLGVSDILVLGEKR